MNESYFFIKQWVREQECVCVCIQPDKQEQSEGTGMNIVYISVNKSGIGEERRRLKKQYK